MKEYSSQLQKKKVAKVFFETTKNNIIEHYFGKTENNKMKTLITASKTWEFRHLWYKRFADTLTVKTPKKTHVYHKFDDPNIRGTQLDKGAVWEIAPNETLCIYDKKNQFEKKFTKGDYSEAKFTIGSNKTAKYFNLHAKFSSNIEPGHKPITLHPQDTNLYESPSISQKGTNPTKEDKLTEILNAIEKFTARSYNVPINLPFASILFLTALTKKSTNDKSPIKIANFPRAYKKACLYNIKDQYNMEKEMKLITFTPIRRVLNFLGVFIYNLLHPDN